MADTRAKESKEYSTFKLPLHYVTQVVCTFMYHPHQSVLLHNITYTVLRMPVFSLVDSDNK